MGAETAQRDVDIARRIFRFFTEVEQARLRPIRTLSSTHRKLWFSDLPTENDGVISGLLNPDHKPWLRIARVHEEEPPPVPGMLEPWITLSDLYRYQNPEPPQLRQRITISEDADQHQPGPAPRDLPRRPQGPPTNPERLCLVECPMDAVGGTRT